MSHTFVPFVSLPSVTSPGAAPATQRPSFSPVTTEVPAPQSEETRSVPGSHQPTIKVHREGDSVRRIQIQCSCGQVIDLECQY